MQFNSHIRAIQIERSNNKILKQTNVLLFDTPQDWYSYHASDTQQPKNALKLFKSILATETTFEHFLVTNIQSSTVDREYLTRFIDSNTKIISQVLEHNNMFLLSYNTKTVFQYIGFVFLDEKKRLMFNLKYPMIDCREI